MLDLELAGGGVDALDLAIGPGGVGDRPGGRRGARQGGDGGRVTRVCRQMAAVRSFFCEWRLQEAGLLPRSPGCLSS